MSDDLFVADYAGVPPESTSEIRHYSTLGVKAYKPSLFGILVEYMPFTEGDTNDPDTLDKLRSDPEIRSFRLVEQQHTVVHDGAGWRLITRIGAPVGPRYFPRGWLLSVEDLRRLAENDPDAAESVRRLDESGLKLKHVHALPGNGRTIYGGLPVDTEDRVWLTTYDGPAAALATEQSADSFVVGGAVGGGHGG